MMNSRLVFTDINRSLRPTYILNYLNMSNVHGFGNFPNQPSRNNLPPVRRNNPNYDQRDDGNGQGFFSAVQEPALEEQLRIAN